MTISDQRLPIFEILEDKTVSSGSIFDRAFKVSHSFGEQLKLENSRVKVSLSVAILTILRNIRANNAYSSYRSQNSGTQSLVRSTQLEF